MAERQVRTIWFGRVLFASLALVCIVFPKIPLGLPADAPIFPDLLFALCLAWVVRSPATATLPIVLAMALLADFVLMRPVGLGAIMLVLASEYFRSNRVDIRERMFVLEWLTFSILYAGITGAQIAVLKVIFAESPPVGLAMHYVVITCLSYPFVVGCMHYIFFVRAPRLEKDYRFGMTLR
jgi:rod shape-determining protein MreD